MRGGCAGQWGRWAEGRPSLKAPSFYSLKDRREQQQQLDDDDGLGIGERGGK